ncbi:MAG TPA: FtsX-like permease family protein [Candidatus Bathyarchaeia archaeon]|nr:FtsX-like permease family protein [Candidatus Bathyarchaeia archaeon]
MSLRLAARNIMRRKSRNILTLIAIVLGTSLLVGVNIASTSALAEYRLYLNRFWGGTDVMIRYATPRPFEDANLTIVSQTEGVEKYAARLYWTALLNNDTKKILTITGIDVQNDIDYQDYNITGSATINGRSIVIGGNAAEDYDIEIGQTINITTLVYESQSWNRTYELSVIGVYHASPPLKSFEILTDLATAQDMASLENKISNIFVKVKDSTRTIETRDLLQEKLGFEFEVLAPKTEAQQTIQSQLQGFQIGLNIMILVALLVCGFLVFNTMFMSVKERTYEIGVLRAVGTSRRQVFFVFIQESIILGVTGTVIGIFAGLLLSNLFVLILEEAFRGLRITAMVLTQEAVVLGFLGGLLMVVGGSVYPSVSASRVNILHALRPEMRVGRKIPDLALLTIGLVIFLMGVGLSLQWFPFSMPYVDMFLVPVGLIVSAAIAVKRTSGVVLKPITLASACMGVILDKNVRRKLLRNAVTIGMIGISLSFTILMGGVQVGIVQAVENSVKEALGADIMLISNQTIPISSLKANLTEMAQIEAVTPFNIYWRGTTKAFNGENQTTVAVFAIEPETFNDVIKYQFVDSPSPEEVFQKLSSNNETLILPDTLATRLNVEVGGNLTLITLTSEPKNFIVAGIFTGAALQWISFGPRPMSESIVISFKSEATYFFGVNAAVFFFVNLKSDYKQRASEVVEEIDKAYPMYNFNERSLTLQNLLVNVRTQVDRIFSIFSLMLYFAILISTLGITIVMIMNVTERRREIGLLRSQGMSRGQILGILLFEAVFLGLVGFLVGLPSGLLLLTSVTNSTMAVGFLLPFIIPWTAIGQALVFSIIASLTGAIYPALRASRMNITRALQQR